MTESLSSSPPELYDEFKISTIKFYHDWVVLPCQNRRNPHLILRPVPVQPFTSTSSDVFSGHTL